MAANIYYETIWHMTISCHSTVCCANHINDPDAFLDLLASLEAAGFYVELI